MLNGLILSYTPIFKYLGLEFTPDLNMSNFFIETNMETIKQCLENNQDYRMIKLNRLTYAGPINSI